MKRVLVKNGLPAVVVGEGAEVVVAEAGIGTVVKVSFRSAIVTPNRGSVFCLAEILENSI